MIEDGKSMSDELLMLFVCRSDSISLEGLHEILQRYGIKSADDSRHINDYEFFHHACCNEHVDEAMIQFLIDVSPDAASVISVHRQTPLHAACCNKNATPCIIRILIDAHPSSRQVVDEEGDMPLHCFCRGRSNNDSEAIEILKILLKDCSFSTKHANNKGRLPIHVASISKSSEFCGLLIDAYPGSERMPRDEHGALPFHLAVRNNDIATIEYLYKLYPEALNCPLTFRTDKVFPIFMAITRLNHRDDDEREGVQSML